MPGEGPRPEFIPPVCMTLSVTVQSISAAPEVAMMNAIVQLLSDQQDMTNEERARSARWAMEHFGAKIAQEPA